MKKRLILSIAILLTVVIILLTSCGTDDTTPPEETTAVSETTTISPEITAQNLNIPETWYLEESRYPDEWFDTHFFPACAEWMQEFEGYYIQTPVKYTETVDGCEVTVDFFKEYYKMGEPLQVRITITNNTGEDIYYDANTEACRIDSMNPSAPGISICELNGSQQLFRADAVKSEILKNREQVVLERLFILDPTKLTYGYDCIFRFYCIRDANIHLKYVRK